MIVTEEQMLIRIKKVCAEVLKVNDEKISVETRFKEDLGADSLDIVSLLMALEDEFKSKISDEDAEKLATVKDLIAFLKSHPADVS